MNWTEEQNRVITERGRNLLVSAAAGSGKTAVLTERIMGLMTDPVHPADIDRLLIVTFTRAAAGEMKARIMKRIADAREADPGNEHLARQSALIHHAQITTIDGFCAYVVRSYAHTREISPDFRVADEGELKLLMHDTAETVIREAYDELAAGTFPEFGLCVDSLTGDRTDDRIEELVLQLYRESRSFPDPDGWLMKCAEEAGAEDPEKTDWMREYLAGARETAESGLYYARLNVSLASSPDGPAPYLTTASAELELLKALSEGDSYEENRRILEEAEIPVLSRKKASAGENPDLRDRFKKNRKSVTDAIHELRGLFSVPYDAAYGDLQKSGIPVRALIRLVFSFAGRYRTAKENRGIMDYADLEHHALDILRDEDGRTEAARELADTFDEVMVDEYQDSNYLQEAVLTAVSRIEDGVQNYFCVGDVKQSIYSFRQARPELFMEKYDRYPAQPETGVRIDLHRNFRSRPEVVDAVNTVFRQIMRRETGGIDYDDDAALVRGADYRIPEYEAAERCAETRPFSPELLLVCTDERDEDGEALLGDRLSGTKTEAEARAVGQRILELTERGVLEDEETHELRSVQFRDIVILMRTVSRVSDVFVSVLTSMQIPVHAEVKGGYFDAPEVQAVLSFLSVLDNPLDDIALTAVLRSRFAEFSAEELAMVRTVPGASDWTGSEVRRYLSVYDSLRQYGESGEDAGLRERVRRFLAYADDLRRAAAEIPLHELVYRMVTETGFFDYASAMPGGAQRVLNLTMLVDQAAAFENTSYVGLFNFVRYIRNLRKQESDLDERSTAEAGGDVVRIMTVHKSKGLEFPVVFLAGSARRFNRRSLNASVTVHPGFGVGAVYVDPVRRVKKDTIKGKAIRQRMLRDSAGEELRLLYVAMTRARQKLIISGTIQDEEALGDKDLMVPLDEEKLPAGWIRQATSCLDWLIPAVLRDGRRAEQEQRPAVFRVVTVPPSALVREEVRAGISAEEAAAGLRRLRPGDVADAETRQMLQERFSFRYPYEGRELIPVELSVSELKHGSFSTEAEEGNVPEPVMLYESGSGEDSCVPGFIRPSEEEKPALAGAARGTAFHRVMELLDFRTPAGCEGKSITEKTAEQMDAFVRDGRLKKEEAEAVSPEEVKAFLESDVGRRMAAAQERGQLYREQPFVIEMPASAIRPGWPEEETVCVQGIVDAFFYEDGDLILLDYKTDRVKDATELVKRYRIQLDSYKKALEQASGRRVRESHIWSFSLGADAIL